MEILTTKLDKDRCPHCGTMLDAATGASPDTRPKPGSFTICCECLNVSAYDDQLKLRRLTEVENRQAKGMPEIQRGLAILRELHAMRKAQAARLN